jgi:hypothetical protein
LLPSFLNAIGILFHRFDLTKIKIIHPTSLAIIKGFRTACQSKYTCRRFTTIQRLQQEAKQLLEEFQAYL